MISRTDGKTIINMFMPDTHTADYDKYFAEVGNSH